MLLTKCRKEKLNPCISNLPYSDDRTICEACENDNDIVNLNGKCETCPEGEHPNGQRDSCSLCKANEIIDFDDICQPCPDGFVPSENRRFCRPCPKGSIAKDGICQACEDPEKQ